MDGLTAMISGASSVGDLRRRRRGVDGERRRVAASCSSRDDDSNSSTGELTDVNIVDMTSARLVACQSCQSVA